MSYQSAEGRHSFLERLVADFGLFCVSARNTKHTTLLKGEMILEEKLYCLTVRVYVHAESEDDALSQMEDYDFNNSIDKGLLEIEVSQVEKEDGDMEGGC